MFSWEINLEGCIFYFFSPCRLCVRAAIYVVRNSGFVAGRGKKSPENEAEILYRFLVHYRLSCITDGSCPASGTRCGASAADEDSFIWVTERDMTGNHYRGRVTADSHLRDWVTQMFTVETWRKPVELWWLKRCDALNSVTFSPKSILYYAKKYYLMSSNGLQSSYLWTKRPVLSTFLCLSRWENRRFLKKYFKIARFRFSEHENVLNNY